MPSVKRFRPLGSSRSVSSSSNNSDSVVVDSVKDSLLQPKHKVVKRFKLESKKRKTRSDKKHKFQLRCAEPLWGQVEQLSMNCGGLKVGASLNVICNRLLQYALEDPEIVKRILNEFPGDDRMIVVRTWEG